MNSRFYSDQIGDSQTATLAGQEAHHLLHVLRGKVGDQVTLFDGTGYEFVAEVSKLSRSEVELNIASKSLVSRESALDLTIAAALPKGDRQRVMIEKCVELGVRRIIPLETERSVAVPKEKSLDKLRRAVIESSKQCGRNRLMEISAGQKLSTILASSAEAAATASRILADPSGEQSFEVVAKDRPTVGKTIAVVGPEGGFSPTELEMAAAGQWIIANLGPRILRIETAAIACAVKFAT